MENIKSKYKLLQKQLRLERLNAGCCAACNNPRHEGMTYCIQHLQKRRKWEAERRISRLAKNGCGSCATGMPLTNTTLCLKCWWQSKAYSIGSKDLNNIVLGTQLQEVWENQKGLCALSGLPLIPGTNASIDHILPKSKGGTNNISNLRWVLSSVNNGKHDLSDEEFINICKAVASHNENKFLIKTNDQ